MIQSLKEWLPVITSAIGLISAVVGVVISVRALLRVKREERLREEEAAYRKLQSKALIEALFGVDKKIAEHVNQLRTWTESKLFEQEKHFRKSLAEVIRRFAPSQQEAAQLNESVFQNQDQAIHTEIRKKEQVLEAIRKAISEVDSGRNLEELRTELRNTIDSTEGGENFAFELGLGFIPLVGPIIGFYRLATKDGRERAALKESLGRLEKSLVEELATLRSLAGSSAAQTPASKLATPNKAPQQTAAANSVSRG